MLKGTFNENKYFMQKDSFYFFLYLFFKVNENEVQEMKVCLILNKLLKQAMKNAFDRNKLYIRKW